MSGKDMTENDDILYDLPVHIQQWRFFGWGSTVQWFTPVVGRLRNDPSFSFGSFMNAS